MINTKIKPIAIYLPQFHPIPQNDEWWGKGFTEWTNVTKATPRFDGHYQPHLPADLGFYDLRLEEARLAQEAMAKAHGIHGFCYYHYWFNGKRILEQPLDRKMQNLKEDFPFMMCWANENWTRSWDGQNKEILLRQEYDFNDDAIHIQHLIQYFEDERYIKVNNKPVFIIYRPNLFPDIEKTITIWKKAVKEAGFPDLYIGYAQNKESPFAPEEKGFDFGFQFQPNFGIRLNGTTIRFSAFDKLKQKFKIALGYRIKKKLGIELAEIDNYYDYWEYASKQIQNGFKSNVYPGLTPMWDNAARRKVQAYILHDSTPEKYEKWLQHIKENYPWESVPENFLFINAWNEWAEGNHLEPCQKWGKQYLEATKKVLD